ncbi:hypothetical protein ACOMHN_001985 [Nucella lapillus]
MRGGKSRLLSRDKTPLTLPLATQEVHSKAACHHRCWTDPQCFFVAYGGPHGDYTTTTTTTTSPQMVSQPVVSSEQAGEAWSVKRTDRESVHCQLLGPTARCSGLVTYPGRLLYRLDKL